MKKKSSIKSQGKIILFPSVAQNKPLKKTNEKKPIAKKSGVKNTKWSDLSIDADYFDNLTIKKKQKLIERYKPLIQFIAKKISVRLPANIEVDDLVSSGVIGLMDAIEKYDPSRDNKFKTYAEFRIRGSILDELRAQDWVPRSVRDKAKMLERVYSKMEAEFGRPPKEVEMAKKLNVSLNEFHRLNQQVRPINVLPINEAASFSASDKKSLLNILQAEGNPYMHLRSKSLGATIKSFIEELPERQRIVLSLYYYEGFNLKKIGAVLGVTESRVSQLHAQSIKKLKNRIEVNYNQSEELKAS